MTLLQLDILLNYYLRDVEYQSVFTNETRSYQARALINNGLLSINESNDVKICITEKGKAHMEQLLRLDYPAVIIRTFDGREIEVK